MLPWTCRFGCRGRARAAKPQQAIDRSEHNMEEVLQRLAQYCAYKTIILELVGCLRSAAGRLSHARGYSHAGRPLQLVNPLWPLAHLVFATASLGHF